MKMNLIFNIDLVHSGPRVNPPEPQKHADLARSRHALYSRGASVLCVENTWNFHQLSWGCLPATADATAAYRARFAALPPANFRPLLGLQVSSLGLGTYLGKPDDATDAGYTASARTAWGLGCNVIDTAINYRHQRSERALGRAIREAVGRGEIRREEIVVATKGGYLPFDGQTPADAAGHLRRTYVDSGLCRPDEIVAGCHCLAPSYLDSQIERSLQNLGVDTIDIYYLHNPEQQLDEVDAAVFAQRMRAAFETLERAAGDGRIALYGTATWNGYRVSENAREHLSLEELVDLAREVAGAGHRFRVIQLPLNLGMPEALVNTTQTVGREPVSAIEAAARLGITVMASGSLLQGRLARRLPDPLRELLPGPTTDAQRALQFVRSAPGVTVALCGMSRPEHVAENLGLASLPSLSEAEFRKLVV